MAKLLTHNTVNIQGIHEELNISHLVEVQQADNSFLISFLYYLGALTIDKVLKIPPFPTTNSSSATLPSSSSMSKSTLLRIPNEQCKLEYIVELQNIFNISKNDEPMLQDVVTQMLAGDIGPLCNFITERILNLQRHNDVVHSLEHSLKSVFILAVSIARGSQDIFSEYDLTKTQADAVFLTPGVHIEFKNTTIGQLEGHYTPSNWEKMNEFSAKICAMTEDEAMSLPLKQFKPLDMYCKYHRKTMTTVKDKWLNTIEQTKENKKLLEEKHSSKKFTSFAVYRLGLQRLFWKKI